MTTFDWIDPVAFKLGPFPVHWYGLMYIVGFTAGWLLGRLRAREARPGWTPAMVDDLVFYVALGVVVGGRVGYVLFYGLPQYVHVPLDTLKVWRGGMSFHGGLLGVLVAAWLFARRYRLGFFQVSDFVAPLVPPGLLAGRIGNFINAELWGKPTDLPWGVVFPGEAAGGVPRHPSQLYEALLEGLVLFALLWLYSRRPRPTMAVSGLFLLLYGIFRALVELVRVPDAHLGYLALEWLTMGQLLSLPMIALGAWLLWRAHRGGPETRPVR
jgi:phosphatidylglycerol:prolipoprotein diacylglycerol transferase